MMRRVCVAMTFAALMIAVASMAASRSARPRTPPPEERDFRS